MPQHSQFSFTGGEISPHIYARIDLARYQNSVKTMRNFYVHEYGGASNRPGTCYIDDCADHDYQSRLIPFSFNTQQNYVLEFSENIMRIIKDGGLVVYPSGHASEGQIVQITAPYAAADLPLLKMAQSADIMTLCHPNYPVYELSRTDHHEWSFDAVSFVPSIDTPSSVSVTASGGGTGTTYKYKVTAVAENGEESLASSEVSCINTYVLDGSPSTYNTISWSAVTGASKYNIYRYDDYSGYVYGFLSSTEATSFQDNGPIAPDVADGPPESRNPFSGADTYPSCAAYYKQRLCFGRSNNYPQRVWMTQTGNYKNMNISRPGRADDSIDYNFDSNQVNDIRHIIPLKDLLILTSGGEWVMSTGGQAVAADTIDFIHESVNGSSHIPPLTIQNSVLYINETGKTIRDLFYRFEDDGYSGEDLTIFSRHLFEKNTLKEWTFQKTPYNIIWVIRDDGKLLGLTYNRSHQVWGWHHHDTQNGAFESLCSITENGESVLYVTVKRTINGSEKRYIEKFASRFESDITDLIFMDSALSYNGSATDSFSGLDHLEGESVSILADGNVHPPQTVTGGSITLQYEAEKVHIGLPITADLETLDLHSVNGAEFGEKRSSHKVTLSVKDTRGLWLGHSESDLFEYKQREQNHGYYAIPQMSDDIHIFTLPSWQNKGRIFIRQSDPLPATILAITPDINISE